MNHAVASINGAAIDSEIAGDRGTAMALSARRSQRSLLAEVVRAPARASAHETAPSATASPQGDMISVQPMFRSPSRSTAAGQAKA